MNHDVPGGKLHIQHLYLYVCRGPGPHSRSQCGRWELLASGRGAGSGASQALPVAGRIPRLGQATQSSLQQGQEPAALFIYIQNITTHTYSTYRPWTLQKCSVSCCVCVPPLAVLFSLQKHTHAASASPLCILLIHIFYFSSIPLWKEPFSVQSNPRQNNLHILAHTFKGSVT